MPYEINSALERLEQNLKDLDSAKKQVEATVSASDKLQQVISGYVKSLVSVQEGLKQWEKELRGVQVGNDTAFKNSIEQMGTSCSEVVGLLKSQLDETKEGFENDTKCFLSKLKSENGNLSDQVNTLKILGSSFNNAIQDIKSVNTLLEGLSNDLKKSQDAQDEALNDIQQKVTNLPKSLHGDAVAITQSITNVITEAKSEIDNKITTKSAELDSNISSIKSLCEGISSSVEAFSGQINLTLDSLKNSEQSHFKAIVKQLGEQEKRQKTEFDVIRKQNSIFSFVIIILLVIIIGLLIYMKPI